MTSPAAAMITAERIEAAAFVDMFDAAPRPFADAVGMRAGTDELGAWLRCTAVPIGLLNRRFAVPDPCDLDALERAIEGRTWVQLPESRADTIAELRARGFVDAPRRAWTKVACSTADAASRPTDARVDVVDPAEAETWSQLICSAHGMPPAAMPWTAALVGRSRWHCLAVREDGAIIGGAALFVDDGAGWLGLGATAPSHRRRGAQTALLHARVVLAAKLGCHTAATETGAPQGDTHDPSLANMFRTGFASVGDRINLVRAS